MSVPEKKVAAETGYGAELQNCVQQTTSSKAADACAANVRAEWAKKDAGVEGGVK